MSQDELEPAVRADDEPEDVEVDLDLDAIDEQLRRERLGKATSIRIDDKVIHILHAGDWPSSAMRAASIGDWEGWAREVIEDDSEFKVWLDADLHNYQIEAVFDQCGRAARMSAGKSRKPGGSQRSSRRR